jgi:hypothetical protein
MEPDDDPLTALPLTTAGAPPRTLESLALALRLRQAIETALVDGGAVISAHETVQREHLLRGLDRACRRAIAACGTVLVDPASSR